MSNATEAEITRREGDLDHAEGLLRSVHGFFRDQGDANNALQIAATLADVLCDMGRFDEASLLAGELARDGAEDDLEVQVAWRSVRARTLTGGGDPTAAVPLAEEAAKIADSTDFVLLQADAYRSLAEALAGAGRSADAVSALEIALARYEAKRATVPAEDARERLRSLRRSPG